MVTNHQKTVTKDDAQENEKNLKNKKKKKKKRKKRRNEVVFFKSLQETQDRIMRPPYIMAV